VEVELLRRSKTKTHFNCSRQIFRKDNCS